MPAIGTKRATPAAHTLQSTTPLMVHCRLIFTQGLIRRGSSGRSLMEPQRGTGLRDGKWEAKAKGSVTGDDPRGVCRCLHASPRQGSQWLGNDLQKHHLGESLYLGFFGRVLLQRSCRAREILRNNGNGGIDESGRMLLAPYASTGIGDSHGPRNLFLRLPIGVPSAVMKDHSIIYKHTCSGKSQVRRPGSLISHHGLFFVVFKSLFSYLCRATSVFILSFSVHCILFCVFSSLTAKFRRGFGLRGL